ncbi:MAG: histidine phosphatase family protein [Sphingomonas adhaesiva]|uniref:histidine phosphatase family protein n=1 Tax=Sphingomonas adhaesiva TaxID=28212 RepID=UPI002FFB6F1C
MTLRQIMLVRHGHHAEVGRVLSGRSDIALDGAGRAQAEGLVRRMIGVRVDAIVSSPRRRALETAGPIATARGLAVEVTDGLDEVDFGDFTGRSFDALGEDADWQRWNAARDSARCPNGETMAGAVARAVGFVAARPPGITLCVTHGDVIRGVVAHYLGLEMTRIFQLECDPGSVTTLVLEGRGARLVALNERG